MSRQTDLRRAVKCIIAEELQGFLDGGWPFDDWALIFDLPEDKIRAEVVRQIEIIRNKS